MSIDPRLMERRKVVAEDTAKRNVGRLLKFLAFVVILGALVWLAFSPWLSVARVEVEGVLSSDVNTALVDHGVIAGTPMILISSGEVEQALLEDPWVAEADVRLHWPDEITVEVVERVPAAWVQTAEGWARRAVDGVALPSEPEPDDSLVRVEMPELADDVATSSVELLGAIEFAAAIPSELRAGMEITLREGELWAGLPGYQVRLGRADEMTEKALSLTALMEESIPEGATINLMAPTNPAYMPPETGEDESDDDG